MKWLLSTFCLLNFCVVSATETPGELCCPEIWSDSSQWNYFGDLSFLYWYGATNGASLAANGVLSGAVVYNATTTTTFYQGFNYHPGFKLTLGLAQDNSWAIYARYTWLRGSNLTHLTPPNNSVAASTNNAVTGTPVLVVSDWFLNGSGASQALSVSAIDSKWTCSIDFIDLCATRSLYQDAHLTISPFGGLRGAFIRQKAKVQIVEALGLFGPALGFGVPPQPMSSRNISHSWGIGPRFGSTASCLIWGGFSINGEATMSMLYTRHTKLVHAEDRASTSYTPGPYISSIAEYSDLLPISELGLGLAWGSYFANQCYHVNVSADYDFTFLWNHNPLRKLLDDTLTSISPSSADLFFHGLTLTGRFDF